MTYKEWMKENHPENVKSKYGGGVLKCPFDYGLEEQSEECPTSSCKKCWNREMPVKEGD